MIMRTVITILWITLIISINCSLISERSPSELKITRTADKWSELFEKRTSGSSRSSFNGGILMNRLLEVDKISMGLSCFPISTCIGYLKATVDSANKDNGNELKRQFWMEIGPFQLTFAHSICRKVIGECGCVLNAEEAALLFTDQETCLIFSCNHSLLQNIQDYSEFTPELVKRAFEIPLKQGLNISTVKSALKTLKKKSLIKLLELMNWDLEEWELVSLIEARGGIDDIRGHLNSWNLLQRFPFLIDPDPEDVSPLTRVCKTLADGNYKRDEMFIALATLIITQENLIKESLKQDNNAEYDRLIGEVDDWQISLKTEFLLLEKVKLKLAWSESNDFKDLKDLISAPLFKMSPETFAKVKELNADAYATDSCATEMELKEILGYWKDLNSEYLGDFYFFNCGYIGRMFMSMVITNFPTVDSTEIFMLINFYYDNRLNVLHHDSIVKLNSVYQHNLMIDLLTWDYNNPLHSRRSDEIIVRSIEERLEIYINEFAQFLFHEREGIHMQKCIATWVEYQNQLQSAGDILKQYDHVYVAKSLLPFILKDSRVGGIIEEHPSIFISDQVLKVLLEDGKDLLKKYPRLLHGFIDYRQFSVADFDELNFDFSQIRYGLITIPAVSIIKYLQKVQGVLDDPISFIGSLNESVFTDEAFLKHVQFLYRPAPLIIENANLLSMNSVDFVKSSFKHVQIALAFHVPHLPKCDYPKRYLWNMVKWIINCELIYLELGLFEDSDNPLVTTVRNLRLLRQSIHKAEIDMRQLLITAMGNFNLTGVQDKSFRDDFADVKKTLSAVPLSHDRVNYFLDQLSSDRIWNSPFEIFPDFRVSFSLLHHFNKFKEIIPKLASNEAEKEFWLAGMAMCQKDWKYLEGMRESASIPVYYKSLMKRLYNKEK